MLGICNGFQILCEAHLLPGALTRNAGLRFITRDIQIRIENAQTPWTRELRGRPGAHRGAEERRGRLRRRPGHAGRTWPRAARSWPATPAATRTARPGDIAGVVNEAGNVVGLMPHPEHAVDALTGPSADGLGFFTSVLKRGRDG